MKKYIWKSLEEKSNNASEWHVLSGGVLATFASHSQVERLSVFVRRAASESALDSEQVESNTCSASNC